MKNFSKIASLLTFILKTSTPQLAKLLPLLVDLFGNTKISNNGDNNETAKKLSSHTKITIRATGYLTLNAKMTFV